MKTRSIILGAIMAVSTLAFAGQTTDFKVDKNKSKVTWLGKKVAGEHSGNISLTDGKLSFDGAKITGGKFVMDMNSITNTDLTDKTYNEKLVGHLKSEDFFGVEKHPTATLTIKSAESAGKDQYKIKGDLTIKGITKEIEFPATITKTASEVKAKAKVIVDRAKYDVKYGSGSFFDNLGDKAIEDNFELNVDLVAKK